MQFLACMSKMFSRIVVKYSLLGILLISNLDTTLSISKDLDYWQQIISQTKPKLPQTRIHFLDRHLSHEVSRRLRHRRQVGMDWYYENIATTASEPEPVDSSSSQEEALGQVHQAPVYEGNQAPQQYSSSDTRPNNEMELSFASDKYKVSHFNSQQQQLSPSKQSPNFNVNPNSNTQRPNFQRQSNNDYYHNPIPPRNGYYNANPAAGNEQIPRQDQSSHALMQSSVQATNENLPPNNAPYPYRQDIMSNNEYGSITPNQLLPSTNKWAPKWNEPGRNLNMPQQQNRPPQHSPFDPHFPHAHTTAATVLSIQNAPMHQQPVALQQDTNQNLNQRLIVTGNDWLVNTNERILMTTGATPKSVVPAKEPTAYAIDWSDFSPMPPAFVQPMPGDFIPPSSDAIQTENQRDFLQPPRALIPVQQTHAANPKNTELISAGNGGMGPQPLPPVIPTPYFGRDSSWKSMDQESSPHLLPPYTLSPPTTEAFDPDKMWDYYSVAYPPRPPVSPQQQQYYNNDLNLMNTPQQPLIGSKMDFTLDDPKLDLQTSQQNHEYQKLEEKLGAQEKNSVGQKLQSSFKGLLGLFSSSTSVYTSMRNSVLLTYLIFLILIFNVILI